MKMWRERKNTKLSSQGKANEGGDDDDDGINQKCTLQWLLSSSCAQYLIDVSFNENRLQPMNGEKQETKIPKFIFQQPYSSIMHQNRRSIEKYVHTSGPCMYCGKFIYKQTQRESHYIQFNVDSWKRTNKPNLSVRVANDQVYMRSRKTLVTTPSCTLNSQIINNKMIISAIRVISASICFDETDARKSNKQDANKYHRIIISG